MCGRFSRTAEFSEIKVELNVERLELPGEFTPLYNVAPSHGAGHEQPFVFQSREGERVMRLGRWWMIPSFWSKPLKHLPAAFNARAEDVASKPFWRRSFEKHRCLIPATGWREFVANGKKKQPYQFKPHDAALFTFAGVWSRWTSPDGEVVDSFAIITTAPSSVAANYHDRMPLVIPNELREAWLDRGSVGTAVLDDACKRVLAMPLDVYATNPIGNSVKVEAPEVIEPATVPG
ncbi:MAG TPA: SOS response-associated peptidase [Polyangiaceae bacterium]|nr:SOS response-associated peptidase [Polyangiaceae bacterium]